MQSRDIEYDEAQRKCADCGHGLDLASERCCAVVGQLELCSACAKRRGGSYDSKQERWNRLPEVADLLLREPPGHAT